MTEFGKTPEFEFSDGVLRITSHLCNMRIQYKPEVLAKEQDPRGRWHDTWPEFPVLSRRGIRLKAKQSSSKDKRESFELFRRTVPRDLCNIVAPFTTHQWQLLRFISVSKPGKELAESNPVLAFALASSYELRRTTPEAAAKQAPAHSRDKQKDLCAWLGFPGTLTMVKLFKKIDPAAATPFRLRCLRNALRRDEEQVMKMLRHRKVINSMALDLIEMPKVRKLVTPKLFDDVEQAGNESAATIVVDQLFHSLDILKQIRSGRELRPFESIRQVENFVEAVDHEYLEYRQRRIQRLEEMRRAEEERLAEMQTIPKAKKGVDPRKCIWPAPPIPGTDTIIPITSFDMICDESKKQKNCISSYWPNIVNKQGDIYAYRLLKPARATFTIVKRYIGLWQLSEIKAKHNRKVSAKTRRVVEDWLYSHSISAST